MKKTLIYLFSVLLLTTYACKKEKSEIDSTVKAPLEIEFDHIVGGKKLTLGATNKNSLNQDFTIDILKYYISNIKLKNTEGKEVVVPQDESYFLVDASEKESCYAHVKIPEGDYTELSFVLGVDSLRNTKPVEERTGDLDPANGMYWTWNSGYIFFKMEGLSSLITSADKTYRLHIGGYGGYDTPTINNIRTITLDLTARGVAKVRADRKANIHLLVDLQKAIEGDYVVDFSGDSKKVNIMSPTAGTPIADNYVNMFTHDHSH
ncbi:MbnP family protein [Pseudopedobacter beijingensis]|uniref:MbnP family protein n=1 Tax=Pseudopedobacter beijingensis TaxID=1207056 RepID=A0ABW4IGI8_9SPHI